MPARVLPFPRRIASEPGEAPLTDEALIASCGVNDTAALGTLFDRHHRSVHRFLARLLGGGSADLDDLLQATFVAIWRSAPRFGGRSSVKSWIFGVALNVARHHLRSEKRRRIALDLFASRPEAVSRSPEDLAAVRVSCQRLEAALGTLPPDQRAAFILCDLEELSQEEAALALGWSRGSVARRLVEARAALQRALLGRPR